MSGFGSGFFILLLALLHPVTPFAWNQDFIDLGLAKPIRQGHYVGYLEMEGRPERIATQLDFFLRSPNNGIERPRVMAIVKLSLGGYNSHEYGSQVYHEIRTNLEANELTLDESSNDLSVILRMGERGGRTSLDGQVWSRTSAMNGVLHLDLAPHEPNQQAEFSKTMAAAAASKPLAPLLQGQYVGTCDGKRAAFQIQTVRGLAMRIPDEGLDLFHYEIVARIGFVRDPANAALPWVHTGNFAGGFYNPFRGRLIFGGPSSTAIECVRHFRDFRCKYRAGGFSRDCQFRREGSETAERLFNSRKHHLKPTADQLLDLPPDLNHRMVILEGTYSGNLHHEASGLYQPISLRVIPSVLADATTENQKLFISTTAITYFGRQANDHFFSHRYDPTLFAPGPGFVLSSRGADSFVLIREWKSGFIRGDWYSSSFGRVGTVELIKSVAPLVPRGASEVPSWQGQYEMVQNLPSGPILRWFQLIGINPAADRIGNTLPIMGNFQSEVGADRIESIVRGRYDPYTNTLGWLFTGRSGLSVISGRVLGEGQISVHWPPSPGVFPTWMPDLDFITFKEVKD